MICYTNKFRTLTCYQFL